MSLDNINISNFTVSCSDTVRLSIQNHGHHSIMRDTSQIEKRLQLTKPQLTLVKSFFVSSHTKDGDLPRPPPCPSGRKDPNRWLHIPRKDIRSHDKNRQTMQYLSIISWILGLRSVFLVRSSALTAKEVGRAWVTTLWNHKGRQSLFAQITRQIYQRQHSIIILQASYQ